MQIWILYALRGKWRSDVFFQKVFHHLWQYQILGAQFLNGRLKRLSVIFLINLTNQPEMCLTVVKKNFEEKKVAT